MRTYGLGNGGKGAIAPWSAEKAVTLFKFYSNGVLVACQPAAGCLGVARRHARTSRIAAMIATIGWIAAFGDRRQGRGCRVSLDSVPPIRPIIRPTFCRHQARRAGRSGLRFASHSSVSRGATVPIACSKRPSADRSSSMLRPLVDTLARCVLAVSGSAAAWLVFVAVAPAIAQSDLDECGERVVGQHSADQRAEDQRAGANGASRRLAPAAQPREHGRFRHPANRSPAKRTPTIRQSEGLQPIVSRPIGSRTGSYQRPTGILQLVTATEPVDPTMGSTFPTPPPERLPAAQRTANAPVDQSL